MWLYPHRHRRRGAPERPRPRAGVYARCASLDIGDDNIEVTWDLEDEEALDPDQLTADERSLEEQCAATLDSIASGGGDARTRVAEHFAQTFQQRTGYAVGEFSIDTNAYAEWATEGLSYRIESVYVFDEPGTAPGTVYFEATTADIAGFTEEFYERAYTYLSEQDLHGAGVSALSNAQRSVCKRFSTTCWTSIATARRTSCSQGWSSTASATHGPSRMKATARPCSTCSGSIRRTAHGARTIYASPATRAMCMAR